MRKTIKYVGQPLALGSVLSTWSVSVFQRYEAAERCHKRLTDRREVASAAIMVQATHLFDKFLILILKSVQLYEWTINLPTEVRVLSLTLLSVLKRLTVQVELIWKSKWNVEKALYIATRYLGFIDTPLNFICACCDISWCVPGVYNLCMLVVSSSLDSLHPHLEPSVSHCLCTLVRVWSGLSTMLHRYAFSCKQRLRVNEPVMDFSYCNSFDIRFHPARDLCCGRCNDKRW